MLNSSRLRLCDESRHITTTNAPAREAPLIFWFLSFSGPTCLTSRRIASTLLCTCRRCRISAPARPRPPMTEKTRPLNNPVTRNRTEPPDSPVFCVILVPPVITTFLSLGVSKVISETKGIVELPSSRHLPSCLLLLLCCLWRRRAGHNGISFRFSASRLPESAWQTRAC